MAGMRRWVIGLVGLVAGCATGSRAVVTGDGVERSPGITREVPGSPGIEVEEEVGRFTFAADGSKVYTYTLRYRVLEPEALERWSKFEVRWNPDERDRPELSARIEASDGTVHHLAPSTAIERPEPSGDERFLSADLPGVDVGAKVERTVVYRDADPPPLDQVSGRYALIRQ